LAPHYIACHSYPSWTFQVGGDGSSVDFFNLGLEKQCISAQSLSSVNAVIIYACSSLSEKQIVHLLSISYLGGILPHYLSCPLSLRFQFRFAQSNVINGG
jgi:hypothetical protein